MIGSGVASMAAIEAVRSVDASGEVLLIGNEVHGFYSRPGLAYYLTGELAEEQLYPMREADFRKLNVRFLHSHVARIDAEQHQIQLQNGLSMSYDRLLIAVGAEAQTVKVTGAALEGVVKLDNLDDAKNIVNLARKARSAVVVGKGNYHCPGDC
jgi:NAD(P)H-nitrite reductase large subunit